MTLREALVATARPARGTPYKLQFCCGFEALHLVTFLKAHLRARLEPGDAATQESRPVEVATGLFGDLAGNIERALAADDAEPLAVVVEWEDLDPRLGLREGYQPAAGLEPGILSGVAARLTRLRNLLTAAAGRRIVLSLPSAPLPVWFPALAGQSSPWNLELRAILAAFAAACAASGVRVAETVEVASAYDFRSHLNNGFPYFIPYAEALASAIAALLLPAAPAKGLVTDLDNTLWAGIVGDDGPFDVHWSLEKHARHHGIYQQFLASLAAQGILIGVASRNDPAPVAEALHRSDLLLPAANLFPVETHWGVKSESIRRIAKAWNIGLDSVVFVDDSPLEVAEVRQALPEVECHVFPAGDPSAVLTLVQTLRIRFARERATDEDRLRAASLRHAVPLSEAGQSAGDPEALLAGLQARISVSFNRDPFDPRSLELLQKTNQFNLNGRRWEESEFRSFLRRPDAVLAVVSYEDRFGALGKIAVAYGERQGTALYLGGWVMSCRAFSRRIEFTTLRALFDHTGAESIHLDWQSTPRNRPAREALAALLGEVADAGQLSLTREHFAKSCPPLYSAVH